jgi:hypothetical protein
LVAGRHCRPNGRSPSKHIPTAGGPIDGVSDGYARLRWITSRWRFPIRTGRGASMSAISALVPSRPIARLTVRCSSSMAPGSRLRWAWSAGRSGCRRFCISGRASLRLRRFAGSVTASCTMAFPLSSGGMSPTTSASSAPTPTATSSSCPGSHPPKARRRLRSVAHARPAADAVIHARYGRGRSASSATSRGSVVITLSNLSRGA